MIITTTEVGLKKPPATPGKQCFGHNSAGNPMNVLATEVFIMLFTPYTGHFVALGGRGLSPVNPYSDNTVANAKGQGALSLGRNLFVDRGLAQLVDQPSHGGLKQAERVANANELEAFADKLARITDHPEGLARLIGRFA